MQLFKWLNGHSTWRSECLNLIASENVMSPLARKYYCTDLMHRYAEGRPFKRYYQGTKYIDFIENDLELMFEQHFNVEFCDVRPISGSIANLAVFSALSNGGKILSLSVASGAHISHQKMGAAGIVADVLSLPDKDGSVDVERAEEMIKEIKPDIVTLGGSLILFPHPTKALAKICEDVGSYLVYDAAHVFGLIFSGFFQDPFREGAKIITASTHKTFPGPQGGIILGNVGEKRIRRKVFPGIVSNHHLHRLPALYITYLEMLAFGKDYCEQILKNAKVLAKSLYKHGLHVLFKDRGFTESHQIALDVSEFGGGEIVAKKLEDQNIILNKNMLPGDTNPKHPRGVRIGVQEMTRVGMREGEMKYVGELIARAIAGEKVREEVRDLRAQFNKVEYCFKSEEEIEKWVEEYGVV